ncbi:MAG: monovalent cation/H(+) antiporter subunit G [Pseudomonadota bacterium]
MSLVLEALSWICLVAGAFFVVVGAAGALRLPDFWSRLHGASVLDTAGAGLILLGLLFQAGLTLVAVKIVLIGIFLALTGPVASHAVANAAFVQGLRPLNPVEDDSANDPAESTDKGEAG